MTSAVPYDITLKMPGLKGRTGEVVEAQPFRSLLENQPNSRASKLFGRNLIPGYDSSNPQAPV